MTDDEASLIGGFLRSAERYPERPAVEISNLALSYRALHDASRSLASTIANKTPDGGPPLTAVFAYRSTTAYAGILGSLMAGNGYVPLNPVFPPERTNAMLQRSGCRSLIADAAGEAQLEQVITNLLEPMLIILPECPDAGEYTARWPQHQFTNAGDLNYQPAKLPPSCSGDGVAYLLFTSGSTGVPKGVAVAHRNVRHFVQTAVERYQIDESDRFSQTFDLTFDLSAFDMFVAWEKGACVCCPSRKALLNPTQFIRDSRLTVWFSVPSVALIMKQLGALKPAVFPSLRWTLFCGEPLPANLAAAWAVAAPQSSLENLYGPTEVTIACTAYRWNGNQSALESERNIVPIGQPLTGMRALVVDKLLREVRTGEEGELLMAGPQVSLGYWCDPQKTAESFVVPPGKEEIYYRTGDRVCRPLADGPLQFRGRLDHQIKVQGYRVELQEVEALLKQEACVDLAIAVGWPLRANGAGGIEAFLTAAAVDLDTVRERLKAKLPGYAVPRKIHLIDDWPLNSNGKIDRGQLLKMLERRL